ncbi:hypothetical protein C4D60_Mb02t11330 [Musa balbisiana]|uniref:Uncharacterized protein n=1 Tax=Musa balbisiana TaxID=52838 RepID=A0A4S8I9X7_MUSBA|nr:hypothetical protein C4D60_Mb02t11330 [Musa balbisiana]
MIRLNPTQFESVLTIIGFDTVSVSILETGLLLPLVQQPFRYVIMERNSSGKYKSDLLMNQ